MALLEPAKKTGYKVIFFPWNTATQLPGAQMSLVDGFLNQDSSAVYARPVDVAVALNGDLFISDDYSGTIFRLSYTGNPLSVDDALLESSLNIFPVPADKKLTLLYTAAASAKVEITLSNAYGQEMIKRESAFAGENKVSIETSNLTNGIYLLTLNSGTRHITRKVVIDHP
jgi:hypothetical protein